jgi:protein-S-isoprenylcysteine O-methyltransferase Ste14
MIRPTKWLSSLLLALAIAVGGGSIALLAFGPLGTLRVFDPRWPTSVVLLWDAALSLIFFVQHSGMIRRGARMRSPAVVAPVYQRAVYAIASGLALLAVVLLWQPSAIHLVLLQGAARYAAHGLTIAAAALFVWGFLSLGAFDPLGTADLFAHLFSRPKRADDFAVRGAYRLVRHPLYLAIIVLLWSQPDLTADRLLLDALWTAWIVVGAMLEEADLVAELGDSYRAYQRTVPMLFPWPKRRSSRAN